MKEMNSYMLIQHLACILMLLAIFGNVTCVSVFPFAFNLSRQLGPPGVCHSSVTKILGSLKISSALGRIEPMSHIFRQESCVDIVTYIQTRAMCRHCGGGTRWCSMSRGNHKVEPYVHQQKRACWLYVPHTRCVSTGALWCFSTLLQC